MGARKAREIRGYVWEDGKGWRVSVVDAAGRGAVVDLVSLPGAELRRLVAMLGGSYPVGASKGDGQREAASLMAAGVVLGDVPDSHSKADVLEVDDLEDDDESETIFDPAETRWDETPAVSSGLSADSLGDFGRVIADIARSVSDSASPERVLGMVEARLADFTAGAELARVANDAALLALVDERAKNPVVIRIDGRPDFILPDTAHEVLRLVVQVLGVPEAHVMLVGPAGSGKSTIAEQAAAALGLGFRSMSVGPTTPTSKLFGYMDAGGNFHGTPLFEAFKDGHLFLVDEVDNGHPGLLSELNQALANGSCAFACGMVAKHPDFHVVATANTYGHGGDRTYVGRNALDGAFLNRFAVLDVPYDLELERALTLGFNPEAGAWLAKVLKARDAAADKRLNVIVSPRASIMGAKLLAAGVHVSEVEEMLLFAGVSDENRRIMGGKA